VGVPWCQVTSGQYTAGGTRQRAGEPHDADTAPSLGRGDGGDGVSLDIHGVHLYDKSTDSKNAPEGAFSFTG
jgi:hypothetical protein